MDGKVLRVRDTLNFKDMHGNLLCQVQEKMLRIKDTMEIEGPHGETLAVVKKALADVKKYHGQPQGMNVQGNILDHEYEIEEGRKKVAEVSKKWFRLRDTYGVEIAPGQNDIIILAATVAIDIMAHPGN